MSKLSIGCPVWACEAWKGLIFTPQAARHDWLRQYSRAFNTVEGNSTFYALPALETARRWCEAVEPGFHFALKVPRAISHDCRLIDCQAELDRFLELAELLNQHQVLGPTFLQLPPDYSPRNLPQLVEFLEGLPRHLPWAVEVRHPAWFDGATNEADLDQQLRRLQIDKVIFDSRPLYSRPPGDDVERAAQSRKPKTPVRSSVTGSRPFLRLIGRNNIEEVRTWIEQWAPIIANWLRQDLSPYVFTHAPDDRFAPLMARELHLAIARHYPPLKPLPPWPADLQGPNEVQLTLF